MQQHTELLIRKREAVVGLDTIMKPPKVHEKFLLMANPGY